MNKKMPLLTVIINSFNYAKFLPGAIESVIDQPFKDYELLIIEDGSTDESLAIAKDFASRCPSIRIIDHKKNKGIFYSIEEGILESKGKYLHWLSADDKRDPTFFTETMEQLIQHPDIPIASSQHAHFIDGSEKIHFAPLLEVDDICIFSPLEMIQIFKKTNFWIPGHTVIVEKDKLLKNGKYDPKLASLSDWYLFHKMAMTDGIIFIPKPLAYIRVHDGAYSNQNIDAKKRIHRNCLDKLRNEDREFFALFKESTLLRTTFKTLFFETVWKPKYWSCYFKFLKRKLHFYLKSR